MNKSMLDWRYNAQIMPDKNDTPTPPAIGPYRLINILILPWCKSTSYIQAWKLGIKRQPGLRLNEKALGLNLSYQGPKIFPTLYIVERFAGKIFVHFSGNDSIMPKKYWKKNKKECKSQKDPHPSKNSFPGHVIEGTFVDIPCFTQKVSGDRVYKNTPTFQPNKNFIK